MGKLLVRVWRLAGGTALSPCARACSLFFTCIYLHYIYRFLRSFKCQQQSSFKCQQQRSSVLTV
jgi:hypothetical protein